MPESSSARIAVLADTSLQRHVLQQALGANGYQVVLNSDPARMEPADLAEAEADLWLVDLAQTEDSPLVDALLARDSTLVLFGEGHAGGRAASGRVARQAWRRWQWPAGAASDIAGCLGRARHGGA